MARGFCTKWWQQRSNLEKTLLSFSTILFLTCIIIILVGVTHHGRSSEDNTEDGVCSTKLCIETAGKIISKADFSVDPCQDFYEFSCGQYIKTHAAPADYPEASVEYESADAVRLQLKNWLESTSVNNISVNNKAKTMFRTCMEYDQSTEEALSILKKAIAEQEIGSWPLLDDFWKDPDVKLEHSLSSLTLLGIPIVFDFKVVLDRDNPGKYISKLSPGYPSFDFHKVHDLRDNPMSQYVESVLLLLNVPKSRMSSEVDDILSSESNILKLREHADLECGDNGSVSGDTVRLERLQDLDRQMQFSISWSELMRNIYSALNVSNNKEFAVELYCRKHIRDFAGFFLHSDKTIYNYFGWRFLASIIQYLGPEFHKLHMDYMRRISESESSTVHLPRWKECLGLVEKNMLPVLASAYKEQELSDALMKEKMKMAAALRSTLNTFFSSIDWLNKDQKQKITQKVIESRFEIPAFKIAPSMEKVDQWFSLLSMHDDHLVLNALRMKRFFVLKELRRLVTPSEEYLEWDQASLTSPGYLKFTGNRIAVHLDKLRLPYFSLKQQSYLNYGAFGTVLARQLNSYLARTGFMPTSPNDTIWDQFLEKRGSKCMNSHRESILQEGEEELSRKQWGEALAELSSVRASYMSYKENEASENSLPGLDLTRDQMFFLSYAQTMCEVRQHRKTSRENDGRLPSRLRVNFALKNLDHFSTAYSCKKESQMNPTKKCQL